MEKTDKKMDKVVTNDGSITFYNPNYDEAYHSKSGAYNEAIQKFVVPCRIEELAKSGKIKILDVCFGLGYNSLAAIVGAKKANPKVEIHIEALESDPRVFDLIKEVNMDYPEFDIIKSLNINMLSITKEDVTINIIIGDALKTISLTSGNFDAVFLDPFSPPKNPELWTEDFFNSIKSKMKPNAVLATYSCAKLVRINLKSAGFIVEDGPVVGRRGPSTIAYLLS